MAVAAVAIIAGALLALGDGNGGVAIFYAYNIATPQSIVIGGGGNGEADFGGNGGNGGNSAAFGVTASGGAGGLGGRQTRGINGGNGSANAAGINAHAGVIAMPFMNSYGYGGGGGAEGEATLANGQNGNDGICIIEW